MRLPKHSEPTVLLVDRNPLKQQLRTNVFRNCEIEVHTAECIAEALRLCRVQRYDIVLLAEGHDFGEVSLFCDELQKVAPGQRIAMLVGPPKYLRTMHVREKHVPAQPCNSERRVHLVEPQSQPSHWSTLVRRLLPMGSAAK